MLRSGVAGDSRGERERSKQSFLFLKNHRQAGQPVKLSSLTQTAAKLLEPRISVRISTRSK